MKSNTLFLLTLLLTFACTDNAPIPEIAIDLKDQQTYSNQEAVETTEYVCVMEKQAGFPGGMNGWKEYQKQHTKTFTKCIEGKVSLSFIVSETGKISKIQVMRGISPKTDEHAIQLMQNSPNWIPWRQNDKPIKSQMSLMIRFPMSHYQ